MKSGLPMMNRKWPPDLPEEELIAIHNDIKDWQVTHGSLVKLVRTDEGHSVLSRPIGVAMFPTLFPHSCFVQAQAVQKVYNELYIRIAEDETWLCEALKDLIASDPLTKILWSIQEQVSREGYRQPLSLGIFRSDYMLHQENDNHEDLCGETPKIKQVEFNTISVAGGSHGNIVADMHAYLARTGSLPTSSIAGAADVPRNHTIRSVASALASAHDAYSALTTTRIPPIDLKLAILFIVQPDNVNICDERPLEHHLGNLDPPVSSFRLEFPDDVLSHTSLDRAGRLLFRPYPQAKPLLTYEVSVVYFRAGHELKEYATNVGVAARLHLERSLAIKCPSILSHLTTFKKVQQVLSIPGTLDRFLSPDDAAMVSKTFAPLHSLGTDPPGMQARLLAMDPNTAANHVLKPSLEGGGHNVYGTDIPGYLRGVPESTWCNYILHELIKPPTTLNNILLSHRGIYRGPVISELGVFGTVLWRRKQAQEPAEILHNAEAGWSFKTKASNVNEMSVIKGHGCFDSPLLIYDA